MTGVGDAEKEDGVDDGPLDGVPEAAAVARDRPRALHYGEFYGLKPLPEGPLLVVHGNCQAESMRVLLQGAEGAPCVSVRIPAVHELAPDEVPLLQRLLARASTVVTQPIADGYHDLPLGSAEVAAAAPGARVAVFPVFRWVGLFPWQAVYTDPDAGDPPVVPYHDLRTLLRALGRPVPDTTEDAVRAVSRWSLAELDRREQRAGAVRVHDLAEPAGVDAAHTANHPGNTVLIGAARRVEQALGWPATAADPGRVLLGGVRTPLEPVVLRALGLDAGAARDHWLVGGEPVTTDEVDSVQRAWYEAHPEVAQRLLTRAGQQLELLGAAS